MSKIYTRTGDRGTTAIAGGERVRKTDVRIAANGDLDELNSAIGVARAFISDEQMQATLHDVQEQLMELMGFVATPSSKRKAAAMGDEIIVSMEKSIDDYLAQTTDTGYFILPGGTPAAAFLQQARAVARRAERSLWALNDSDTVDDWILRYVNRLSDLLFIMARYELQTSDRCEELWRQFGWRRR